MSSKCRDTETKRCSCWYQEAAPPSHKALQVQSQRAPPRFYPSDAATPLKSCEVTAKLPVKPIEADNIDSRMRNCTERKHWSSVGQAASVSCLHVLRLSVMRTSIKLRDFRSSTSHTISQLHRSNQTRMVRMSQAGN